MAFVYTKPSKEALEWQEALYDAIIEKTALKGNRSIPLGKKNLHECRESEMPCVLVECGFMDSKTDVPIILTDKFAEQVATACVEVIVKKAKLKKRTEETEKPKKNDKVLDWQKAAIKDGFTFQNGANGLWDKACEAVAKNAVCKKRITYKYKNLTKLLQKAVGIEADGKFGTDTRNAVIKFQKKHKLTADGCVGPATWKKILGVE